MEDETLEILNKIYDYGYEAYAVGGFVRDKLLDIPSNDIDITTNATPMELKNIFPTIKIPKENYGSVTLYYKGVRFEITTYRIEIDYLDNRHPTTIKYVNDLKTDLTRRDFTINTICLDRTGQIVDLLNGIDDLNNHLIRTIINSETSFETDALRILRAVRFAVTLDFKLSDEIIKAIGKKKELLKKLSWNRKKYELDHIFASPNAKKGIALLKELDLLSVLNINDKRIQDYSDLIGIWAMINPSGYNFTNSEKELIKKINIVYNMDNLNKKVLYEYGLYVNVLAGLNKGISKKMIIETYQNMPIHARSDILLSALDICHAIKRKPGSFINDIYKDLEQKILDNELNNVKEELIDYVTKNY